MKAHKLIIPRTAHYYTLGNINEKVQQVWIACHGYGQAAERFITKFEGVANERTLIVAPEALSRFYWGGFTGDVVASWMTSGDRLDEIADFARYLQMVYDEIIPQLNKEVQINIFGFSQGVATIIRWLFQEKPLCHNLILWAGTIPDELDYSPHLDYLADKKIHFVYGLQDQFLTSERLDMWRVLAKNKGIVWTESHFEGKHLVDKEALKKVVEEYVL